MERFGSWDDARLVARAQGGDTEAFEVLLRRHEHRAYAVAVRVLGNRVEADDAVQEAYVIAWRRLGSFRGESSFSTWLYRVVVNACLDATKRRRPHVDLDAVRDHDDLLAAPDRHGPELTAEQHEVRRAVNAALQALPPSLRTVWVLREVEGCSYEEVADIVGTSTSTVRGRLHRARVQLAHELEEWR